MNSEDIRYIMDSLDEILEENPHIQKPSVPYLELPVEVERRIQLWGDCLDYVVGKKILPDEALRLNSERRDYIDGIMNRLRNGENPQQVWIDLLREAAEQFSADVPPGEASPDPDPGCVDVHITVLWWTTLICITKFTCMIDKIGADTERVYYGDCEDEGHPNCMCIQKSIPG